MQLFFVNKSNIDIGDICELDSIDSKHLIKVLRKQINDEIILINGDGNFYFSRIVLPDFRRTEVKVFSVEKQNFNDKNIKVAIAPTKNNTRIEWFVEKVVEIGVNEISFVLCENSERKNIQIDRLKRIIISAMKQSYKAKMPIVSELITFDRYIENVKSKNRYIAYCEGNDRILLSKCDLENDSVILIGPEGDFSKNEIQKAQNNNFITVSLGDSRLRTETAGIYAVSILNALI